MPKDSIIISFLMQKAASLEQKFFSKIDFSLHAYIKTLEIQVNKGVFGKISLHAYVGRNSVSSIGQNQSLTSLLN
jgi:hypothetical protein